MRLDHISYVASHDQISDVVQRIGSQLGTAFLDGGIHPQFGTRNFTAPLLSGRYLEVVCPLEHPASESTPFGQAVLRKAREGGGWLTWVYSTEDIGPLERKFSRPAVIGHRKKPDGSELQWKQIGVKELADDLSSPFYIEWLTPQHPSQDGVASTSIVEIVLAGASRPINELLEKNFDSSSDDGITISWNASSEIMSGIDSILFVNKNQEIRIS